MKLMMECVDEFSQEMHRYINYQRQTAKQQVSKTQYQLKRKQENEARIQRGEAPLPEEDLSKIFKPLQPPGRLEALLTSAQMDLYTKEVKNFATQSFGKLFVADQFQNDLPAI